ncbi:MAG: CinA family protein, partial [Alphaproteobacteria bacterium]|nr:CinA family protein [Alphaproteobacteria bacterium]
MNESCIPEELAHAAKRVVKRLAARGLTVIAAESCTAGLIAATLSVVDGAGKILHGSFVTYTKQAKSQALGIPMKILKKETSVAHRVAWDMLRGALRRSPADIAL